MTLTIEQAQDMTRRRDAAMMAGDVESYMALWADELVDEEPLIRFDRSELRAAIEAAFIGSRVRLMVTRSLGVAESAMFYEWTIVWEDRSSGERRPQTGMTYHEVDDSGRWCSCRVYWDAADQPRRSALAEPEVADLLP